jgi:cytochrome c553
MKNTLIFLVFVLAVLALLSIISGKRVPPPFIPQDSQHSVLNDPNLCLECHGPDKTAPLKKAHPPKGECLKCHKVKGEGKDSKRDGK